MPYADELSQNQSAEMSPEFIEALERGRRMGKDERLLRSKPMQELVEMIEEEERAKYTTSEVFGAAAASPTPLPELLREAMESDELVHRARLELHHAEKNSVAAWNRFNGALAKYREERDDDMVKVAAVNRDAFLSS